MSYIYAPYIPLLTTNSYNHDEKIRWEGPMFGVFIREFIERETSWEKNWELSKLDVRMDIIDNRHSDIPERDYLIDLIWQTINRQDRFKNIAYYRWRRGVIAEYKAYIQSKFIIDDALIQVVMI